MSEARRAAKRFKRENRQNKGVSTAAKIQARNSKVRDARDLTGWQTPDEGMLLMAAALMSRRRK